MNYLYNNILIFVKLILSNKLLVLIVSIISNNHVNNSLNHFNHFKQKDGQNN
jgi:hypothetical protein